MKRILTRYFIKKYFDKAFKSMEVDNVIENGRTSSFL